MSKPKDSFRYFIYLSVGFHAVVFLFLTVKVLFFPDQAPEHRQSVRIDVVALPEKVTEPPKPPAATPKPAPKLEKAKPKEVKKKPVAKKAKPKKPKAKLKAPAENKKKRVKDDQSSAIARLKALQKLKSKNTNKTKEIEYKGNAISKGNSLQGLEKLHHNSYLDEVETQVRTHWNLPEWLANGNLKARVLLLVRKNGVISEKSFVVKSGNDLFDQYVIDTLEKSSPLPPPPSNLVDFYSTTGFEIGFPE